MAVWAKAAGKLIAVLFVGGIIEGCVLRDPWVELNNGYNIGAISWSSQCHLTYFNSQDRRPPSPWSALDLGDMFILRNSDTDESREYKTKAELQQAARNVHARPTPGRTLLDDVKSFAANNRFAIGECAEGCFLLDMAEDTLETWPTHDEWSVVARARTGLNPERLRDPKDWWVQYRPPGYWAIMGSYLGLGVAWIAVPLLRRRASQPAVAG